MFSKIVRRVATAFGREFIPGERFNVFDSDQILLWVFVSVGVGTGMVRVVVNEDSVEMRGDGDAVPRLYSVGEVVTPNLFDEDLTLDPPPI